MFVDRNTSSYSLDEIKHSSEQRIKKCSYRDLREGLVKKVTKINFKFEKTYQIVLTGSWASSLVIDLYLDFRMRKVERSAKQKIGTLRYTTWTWTTRPSKQILHAKQREWMSFILQSILNTVVVVHRTSSLRALSRLKEDVSSRSEKSCYFRLNSTRDDSRLKRTGGF